MADKVNQRVMLTRRLLRESLMELMKEKSIQKISAVELCGRAGINRSTFYTHYGCVADVLREMEDDLISGLEQIWRKERIRGFTAEKGIRLLCGYLREHEKEAKTILRCNDVDSDFALRLMRAYFVREVFEQTASSRFGKEEKEMLFTYLTQGEYSIIRHWLLSDSSMSVEALSGLIGDVSLNGWMKRD